MRIAIPFAVVLILAIPAADVFGWASDHPRTGIQFGDGAPKGVDAVISHKAYVGGYFFNEFDSFSFAGDTEAFNDFIALYGKSDLATHTLVLSPGRGLGGSFTREHQRPVDWTVGVYRRNYSSDPKEMLVTVNLYLGGDVSFRDIKVPLNVDVASSGEIERFIKEHQARQAAEKVSRKGSDRSESVKSKSRATSGPKLLDKPRKLSDSPFAIYLLAAPDINAKQALELPLDRIPLSSEPLLTIDDFTSYSWSTHQFGLTPEAQKKIPDVKSVWGVPFVVASDGSRLYLGAFYSSYSSASFPNPVIDIFGIGNIHPWQFARAYPGAIVGQEKPDPRENSAIKKAFEKAGKLKE